MGVVTLLHALLLVLLPASVWAQKLPNGGAEKERPAATREEDEPSPDSPRASMRRYLDLCRRGEHREAAAYLDVPRADAARAPELASRNCAVLQRTLWIEPESLSPRSAGRKDDTLPPGTDEIGRIRDKAGRSVPIRIIRKEPAGDAEARWVFSQQTVARIDEWYDMLEDRWLRAYLPPFLLREGPKALLLWQWLALPALFFASTIVGRLLQMLTTWLATRVVVRTKNAWDDKLVIRLQGPVALGWSLVVFAFALSHVALYVAAESFVMTLVRATAFGAFFWALVRAVMVAGEVISESPGALAKPSLGMLSQLGQRTGKITVVALGTVAVINELGYPVASLITGLGIGGVALALAATKTVENLFGSVSILVDQPFKIGETIKVDTVEGTVETIGLRSTRLRTADRTLVVIPNGKLADMRIEALGARDRFRFVLRVPLDPRSPRAEVEALVKALDASMRAAGSVRPDDVLVRVKAWSDVSLDVEATAYVEVPDLVAFTTVRQTLLLDATDLVGRSGLRLATPPPVTAPAPVISS